MAVEVVVTLAAASVARLLYLSWLERRGADPVHIERMGEITGWRIDRRGRRDGPTS